jgi:hypothetical protein
LDRPYYERPRRSSRQNRNALVGNGWVDLSVAASFPYDAFICYRHVDRDRKGAEWLIDGLERYRVPEALQQRGFPPRLRKIFRDDDEVPASGDLNDQIKKALLATRFLIVVCSAFIPRFEMGRA